MSIFDAAAQLGTFPSGVILGLTLGIISLLIALERRLPRPKAIIFIGDMLTVLFFSFCLFSLGVGMEGRLHYPTVCGTVIGFASVWCCAKMLKPNT